MGRGSAAEGDVEAKQHRLFVKAMKNRFSTFQYWAVARIKCNDTDSVKTVCVKGKYMWFALFANGYSDSVIDNNKQRYYVLPSGALENIEYYEYPVSGFEELAKEFDFDRLLRKLRRKGYLSIKIKDDDHNVMAMLAQLFF